MERVNESHPTPLPLPFTFDLDNISRRDRYYSYVFTCTCIVLALFVRVYKARQLAVDVPLEGPSGGIASYFGTYDFIRNTKSILRKAYRKYGKGTFRVPGLDHDTVVINKRELIDEIRKAPDDVVSFSEAMVDIFASRWTIGINIARNHYHAHVVQNALTRSLNGLFNDIRDEISQSFIDLVPANTDEWIAIPALETMKHIVCRASNRVFVGLPLCRDPDYIDLNINFSTDVMKTIYKISKIPVILRPIFGNLISSSPKNRRRAMKRLQPLLEKRFRLYDENGNDWPDKPNDLLSWLIDEAPEDEKRSVYEITKRVLIVNVAAIHTSANSFTHALFHLAAEPQYIQPLREEAERVIKEEGFTKVAMTKMWKLDSFMRESQRMNGVHLLSMNRKVMTDTTLSDGTFLPAGAFVAANVTAVHNDEAYYPNAEKFDGFRFAKMREESIEEGVKHQMVNTSADYLAFGHGRHACPGRFFAVNELKALMVHILLEYELKAEIGGVRPENVYLHTRLSPNPTAKVLLKKRVNA